MKRTQSNRAAFTLIEVLLVIGILVVLGGVAVGVYSKVKSSSDKKATTILVSDVAAQVERYQIDMGSYPAEEGLTLLIEKPEDEKLAEKWAGPYLKNGVVPTDPWGEAIKYEKLESQEGTGAPFKVFSTGPDREEGTDDDISNVVTKTE